jgi:hypothetical protein
MRSIQGSIRDSNNRAVEGLVLELIPADKTGTAKWLGKRLAITDKKGEYEFINPDPGDYLVAIHKSNAPDANHPFAETYYPGTSSDAEAEHIKVKRWTHRYLRTVRLQRLKTEPVEIHVVWEDGTSPERSSLLFHNASYPNQTFIGDIAPEIKNGKGQFILPLGFTYHAQAKVDCDAVDHVESRESKLVHITSADNNMFEKELTFVIPGPACNLWQPQ